MKIFFVSLLVCVIATSCSDNKAANASGSAQQIAGEGDKTLKVIPHTAAYFYKRYEGTIAGQAVVMYLEKDDTNFNGYYYYSKIGKPITLAGTAGSNKDSLVLQEYQPGNSYTDAEVPELRCAFSGQELAGEWVSKQKKYPIILKEKYPEGSYSFEMKKFRDTAMLINDPKAPFATSSCKIPFATGEGEDVKWLNDQIKKSLGSGTSRGTTEAIVQELADSFFASYRRDNTEEINDLKNSEEGYPYRLNYDETMNYIVRYNENALVTIEGTVYSYTGGAHGNYGSLYKNYDVTNRKELQLRDIISADSATLQKIVEQQFRIDYKLPSPKPLTEILFDPHLATTDNFYLSEKGLGFVYNPYEVAAYVVGQVEVFVPYTVLSGYLTPEFRKRIKF